MNAKALSLRSYAEWKHCITQLCRIPLTLEYVSARADALSDTSGFSTQRFVEAWGDAHRERVLAWFRQAREDLISGGGS